MFKSWNFHITNILRIPNSSKPWDYLIFKLVNYPKSSSKSNLQIVGRSNPQNIQIFKIHKTSNLKSLNENHQIFNSSKFSNAWNPEILKIRESPTSQKPNPQNIQILKKLTSANHQTLKITKSSKSLKISDPQIIKFATTWITKSSQHQIFKILGSSNRQILKILKSPNL